MAMPRIEVVEEGVTSELAAPILGKLLDFNMPQHAMWCTANSPSSCVILTPTTLRAAYMVSQTDHGWTFVKLLIVPEAHRGKGLGRKLMDEAERIARRHESEAIRLETFDFQARPFYERLGFQLFGELEAGAKAHGQYFLKKRLSIAGTV